MSSSKVELRESLSSNPIRFRTREEFMGWYSNEENAVFVNNLTTKGINNKIKVNGFKFGRRGGKLVMMPSREVEPPPVVKPSRKPQPQQQSSRYRKRYEESSEEDSDEYDESYESDDDEYLSSEEEEEYIPPKRSNRKPVPKKTLSKTMKSGPSTHFKLNSLNGRMKTLEKFAEEAIGRWNQEDEIKQKQMRSTQIRKEEISEDVSFSVSDEEN